MNRAGVYALMLGVACWGGWQWWQDRPLPVAGGPGVRAAAAPVQIDLRHEPPLQKNGYALTPLALFDLTALILSKSAPASAVCLELTISTPEKRPG